MQRMQKKPNDEKPNIMRSDQKMPVAPTVQKPKQNSSQSSKTASPTPKINNHIPDNTFHFLYEIIKNISKPINHRIWIILFMSICSFIMMTSYTAYNYLHGNVLLPSRSTLNRFLKTRYSFDVNSITQLEQLEVTIKNYKKTNQIDDDTNIAGILAVDTVSLNPHITIDTNKKVHGLTQDIELEEEEFERLNLVFNDDENLIKKLKNQIISIALVYYFEPISPLYKCFYCIYQRIKFRKSNN